MKYSLPKRRVIGVDGGNERKARLDSERVKAHTALRYCANEDAES